MIDTGLEVLESIETLAQRIRPDGYYGRAAQSQQVQAGHGDNAAGLNVPVGTYLTRVARVI